MTNSEKRKFFVEVVAGWRDQLERCSDRGPARMLDRLIQVATAQERRHRRALGGRYRGSVAEAAAYFAVRAVCAGIGADVAGLSVLREDYQVGGLLAAYPLSGETHTTVGGLLLSGASAIRDTVEAADYDLFAPVRR